jgi:hypothetical protein
LRDDPRFATEFNIKKKVTAPTKAHTGTNMKACSKKPETFEFDTEMNDRPRPTTAPTRMQANKPKAATINLDRISMHLPFTMQKFFATMPAKHLF